MYFSTMKQAWFIATLCLLATGLSYCAKKPAESVDASPWLNHSDTAQYVGMSTCRQCHSDKHSTYIHTGMGLSFDRADKEKSAALFGPHILVYDTALNLYYKPFWRDSVLMITEFRLNGTDTVHKRTERIDYIIGSGQHTNSHLLSVNGYQAPITFYTQKKEWDMAPGMSGGFNSRFSRVIETECITCHNGLPELVTGSVNKYASMPLGIDCERCHGPGSVHVAAISAGIVVDTATEIDYTIVNPAHLSVDAQNNLCFRCHLQGVNVLHPGAEYADFKPGQQIKDYWNIFLPRFDGRNDKFLMASQADRMVQSECFIQSGEMSCITCHNPHLTVKETPVAVFNKPCQQCHGEGSTNCTETLAARQVNGDNCSGCHIPKSGSIDIPHVSISDHKIQVPGREKEKEEGTFQGLVPLTDDQISDVNMARGYLRYFESYVSEPAMLDSAAWYFEKDPDDPLYLPTRIHWLYLKGQFDLVAQESQKMDASEADSWTAYRVGESLLSLEKPEEALAWLERAVTLLPLNLDFNLKYGSALFLSGNRKKAEEIFLFITKENPQFEKAWMNLSTCYALNGDLNGAESALLRAISLDPDYLQARLSLADLYLKLRQKSKAANVIRYLETFHPNEPMVGILQQQYRSL